MSLDFGQTKVERIGQGWRFNPAVSSNVQAPAYFIKAWQTSQVQLSEQSLSGDPIVVVAWLAGESEGRVYQFYQQANQLFVKFNEQTYELMQTNIADLTIMSATDA